MQRKSKHFFKSVMMLGSVCLLLGACGSQSKKATTAASSEAAVAVASSETVKDTRSVTDTRGDQVEIPQDVEGVAATIGAFAQITALLGGEEQLVATITNLSDMYQRVWPAVNPGGYDAANAEAIIESGAQVVYGPNISDEETKQLNDAGIAVVIIDSFATSEELQASITLIGEILGGKAPEKAQAFNAYYDKNIQYVKDKTTELAADQRVKVLNLRYSGDAYSTVNQNDISTFYAEAAGGIVVSADYSGTAAGTALTVSSEQILQWQPEVIFTMGRSAREQIVNDPALASVPAVKNERVYTEPSGTYPWSVRSAEGALMPLFLAKIMYPDIFADLSLADETSSFYQEFYDYRLSDEECAEILAGRE